MMTFSIIWGVVTGIMISGLIALSNKMRSLSTSAFLGYFLASAALPAAIALYFGTGATFDERLHYVTTHALISLGIMVVILMTTVVLKCKFEGSRRT